MGTVAQFGSRSRHQFARFMNQLDWSVNNLNVTYLYIANQMKIPRTDEAEDQYIAAAKLVQRQIAHREKMTKDGIEMFRCFM